MDGGESQHSVWCFWIKYNGDARVRGGMSLDGRRQAASPLSVETSDRAPVEFSAGDAPEGRSAPDGEQVERIVFPCGGDQFDNDQYRVSVLVLETVSRYAVELRLLSHDQNESVVQKAYSPEEAVAVGSQIKAGEAARLTDRLGMSDTALLGDYLLECANMASTLAVSDATSE